MKQYKSHKIVGAEPMTAKQFFSVFKRYGNKPNGTSPLADGYHVVYSENTPEEYHSWSPKKAFDEGYTEI